MRLATLLPIGLLASTLHAAGPVLEEISPRGAQRGAAFKLTLTGVGLDDQARIISTLPATFTPLTVSEDPETAGKELPFLVELEADAPVEVFPVRVETAEGLSNALLFTVGAFPETSERESLLEEFEPLNNDARGAEEIEIPSAINGTLIGPDRDVYRFRATEGQRVVWQVEARRIGSAIDPALRLTDATGRPIARNNDGAGLGVDARIAFTAPAGGEYFIEVQDAKFSSQKENFYRLIAGDADWAEGLFPLGWRRGETVEVELFGGSFSQPGKVSVDLREVPEGQDFVAVPIPGKPGSLPLRLAVTDDREILEAGGEQQRIAAGTVVNGRISSAGEIDRYLLSVEPGEDWRLELDAAALGTSSLYGVVTVYDPGGNLVASTIDVDNEKNPYAVIVNTRTGEDPFLSFKAPPGVNEVQLAVEDLLGRGGPQFAYRLAARREAPDFTLSLATPYVNIPLRGTATVRIDVKRRGYLGPIEFEIPNLPDDLILDGGHLVGEAPNAEDVAQYRTGFLTLTPKPGAEPRALQLEIWGRGKTSEGNIIRRRASAPGMLTDVAGSNQRQFQASFLGMGLPARIAGERPAVLDIVTPRKVPLILGQEHELQWSFTARDPSVAPPEMVQPVMGLRTFVKRGEGEEKYTTSGTLTIVTSDSAGFGTAMESFPLTFDMLLNAPVMVNGRQELIPAPMVTFEVSLGYEFDVSRELSLSPGEENALAGSVVREPGFDSPVEIKVEGLPPGVACAAVNVPGDQTEFQVKCGAEPAAAPGQYEISVAAESSLPSQEGKYTPLKQQPIAAKLVVEGPGQVARATR